MLLFGLSFFFINFGPNTTTFLVPSEVYPTTIRATAHGLSAAIGKIGAFIGAFVMPLVLHRFGLNHTMGFLAVLSGLGIITTQLLPEMTGVALDEVSALN